MKAIRVHGPGHYSIDEVDEPVAGPKDVVVKVAACGVCGTDVHFVRNGQRQANGDPLPLGHEAAGIVEVVGSEVTGFAPGQRVFINPMLSTGDEVIGNGGREGAFAPRLLVRSVTGGVSLLPVPEGIGLDEAALVEPLAVGMHGINRGNPTADSKVAVFGCGPIGLAGILWLARRGVNNIVAVDISEARLEKASKLGAHATINPSREDLGERLREYHGEGRRSTGIPTVGTDVFYDMAGGKGVIPGIIAVAQHHARLVVSAVYPQPLELNMVDILVRELEITTACGYPIELDAVLAELPKLPKEILATYVSHRFPFERFDEAFAAAQLPESAKVMVTFPGD
ncbi:MAG TPA: alcohol dehydrogenase catalytic domain-containing protein [Novosphingobium sp.]|nr:alcohol dehydrogenase catalytic domain-containing protein [Novosphingobium sp.]